MQHYYTDIIRLVRIRLNQPAEAPSAPKAFQSVVLPLDELIASVIEESVVETVGAIPASEYPEPITIPDTGSWISEYDMVVQLPGDFGRLVSFRLSGWERFVDRLILPSDPDYPLMFSHIRMFRGTPLRPKCYLVPDSGGLQMLASSVDRPDEKIVEALYVPVPKKTGNAAQRKIEFPASMLDPVVALAAIKTRNLMNFNS